MSVLLSLLLYALITSGHTCIWESAVCLLWYSEYKNSSQIFQHFGMCSILSLGRWTNKRIQNAFRSLPQAAYKSNTRFSWHLTEARQNNFPKRQIVCLSKSSRTYTNYTLSSQNFRFEFVQHTAATKVTCFFNRSGESLCCHFTYYEDILGELRYYVQLRSFFTFVLDGAK